jgi:hypothetical protein
MVLGRGVCAAIDPLLMILPPRGFWFFMILTASCEHRNTPVRFVFTMLCHCSSVRVSRVVPGALMPALLNSRSRRPNTSTTFVKSLCTDLGSVTSPCTGRMFLELAPASSATACSGASRLPVMATRHPSPASASAAALPIPVPPPVTIATLPSELMRFQTR